MRSKKEIKIILTENEINYLKFLIESEVFKLKGLNRIVKKKIVNQSLSSAEGIKKKVESTNYSFK